VLTLFCGAQPAWATPGIEEPTGQRQLSFGLSEFGIDDSDPERTIPPLDKLNANPLQAGYLLMDLGEKAEQAQKAGRHLDAARFYRAMARMVPDRATAFSKLCKAYQAGGDLPRAIEACSFALSRTGVKLEDYVRFGEVVLLGAKPLTPVQIEELGAVIAHLRTQGRDARVAAECIECEIAFRLDDENRLRACTSVLAELAPNDPKTISYQWSLALLLRDFSEATELVGRAKALGVDAGVVERMGEVTRAAIPVWRRTGVVVPALAGLLLVGAAVALLLVMRRSLRSARAVPALLALACASGACSRSVPDAREIDSPPSPGHGTLELTPAAATVASGPRDPEACRKCKATEERCGTPEQACGYLQGKAEVGPRAGTSRRQLCLDAIACVERTECARFHTSQCYCGDVGIDECTAGKAGGPCKAVLEGAFEVTSPHDIGVRYDKKQWAGGVAIDRADCLNFLCKAACR
jgi:hypothetical protein